MVSNMSVETGSVPLREFFEQKTEAIKDDVKTQRDDFTRRLEAEIDTLRRLMDERDRLYMTRFQSSDTAVDRALAAQEKAVAAAFLASEKAIIKAEDAQREYNIRSNEFRGQLDDQAKTLMPRPETLTMFSSTEEKINSLRRNLEDKISVAQSSIGDLQLSKAELQGKASQSSVSTAFILSAIGLALGIVSLILRFVGQ